ncbi:hypothetical protein E1287_07430 [Actinomadura sp. KC06]|uniref:hypothetical protein n=1 Tax=Actinomadura sp. KC06 TaxID=2530369 RepID=UPI001043F3B2|nr:hypothetical protein [Actinomadura sp. KC06]TDD37879.1 hypothetical protein E1287_07430 [Actinomadura sp. KC06]
MPDTTTAPAAEAPYLTLRSEKVQTLPDMARAEVLGWLQDATPDPDVVYRVTFDPRAGATAPLYVTEIERDDSSPVLARVHVVPGAGAPPLPVHLRDLFDPCDDIL